MYDLIDTGTASFLNKFVIYFHSDIFKIYRNSINEFSYTTQITEGELKEKCSYDITRYHICRMDVEIYYPCNKNFVEPVTIQQNRFYNSDKQ